MASMGDMELGEHLAHLAERYRGGDGWSNRLLYAARGILANPQAHIDALVEVGVLQDNFNGVKGCYRVVQPHVHEWRVVGKWGEESIEVACVTCPLNVISNARLPNRLPIEVPDA